MNIRNEFILDGRIQKDLNFEQDDMVSFNISSITGIKNNNQNKYTFIRVLYDGDVPANLINILYQGVDVRLYGKLDSEQYIDKKGKTVYNKILLAKHISVLDKNGEEIKVV